MEIEPVSYYVLLCSLMNPLTSVHTVVSVSVETCGNQTAVLSQNFIYMEHPLPPHRVIPYLECIFDIFEEKTQLRPGFSEKNFTRTFHLCLQFCFLDPKEEPYMLGGEKGGVSRGEQTLPTLQQHAQMKDKD